MIPFELSNYIARVFKPCPDSDITLTTSGPEAIL